MQEQNYNSQKELKRTKRAILILILPLILFGDLIAGVLWGYANQKNYLQDQGGENKIKKFPEDRESKNKQGNSFSSELHYQFGSGDNFYQVLKKYGISEKIIWNWLELSAPFYNLAKIQPGQEMWLRYDLLGALKEFELRINSRKSLIISQSEAGFRAELKSPSIKIEEKQVSSAPAIRKLYSGEISTSFYQAGMDSGMSPELILNTANLFWGVIDFAREARKGDQFFVMTEKAPDGEERILMVELEAKKKWYQAYYYKDVSGSGYYDEKGYATKGFYLTKPILGGRISSGFSYHRFHPILHRRIPHLAVDYAAPAGTPVRAAGNGIITYAGWKGGFGNYIEIKHNPSFTTTYGHLKKFAPGIKKGVRVKQGQTIGYVGSTGLATGPHLDYRVIREGKNVNPLRVKSERIEKVNDLKAFNQARLNLLVEMETLKLNPFASLPEIVFSAQAE